MAQSSQIESAALYDERAAQKAIKDQFAADVVYIQYAKDEERLLKQRKEALETLRYYRETRLTPTNRLLIPTKDDMRMLIEALGLEDLE